MSLDYARQALLDGAVVFAAGDRSDRERQRALCEAAKAYTRAFDGAARNPPGAPPSQSTATDVTVPFGRDKGVSITKVDLRGLRWLRDVVGESVDDEAKQRFRAQNIALLDAIEAELARRGES